MTFAPRARRLLAAREQSGEVVIAQVETWKGITIQPVPSDVAALLDAYPDPARALRRAGLYLTCVPVTVGRTSLIEAHQADPLYLDRVPDAVWADLAAEQRGAVGGALDTGPAAPLPQLEDGEGWNVLERELEPVASPLYRWLLAFPRELRRGDSTARVCTALTVLARRATATARAALVVIAAALSFVATAPAAAQVTPSAVYLTAAQPVGTLTITNDGTEAQEIDVRFGWGHPVADSLGNPSMLVLEDAPAGQPNAKPFLRAFPRRALLEPGQTQLVRIIASPPVGLPDGEYWARVVIRSTPAAGALTLDSPVEGVLLDVVHQTVLGVTYRQGTMATEVSASLVRAAAQGDSASVLLDLDRSGNAAWLGRMRAQLVAPGGQVLDGVEIPLAVFRPMRVRLDLSARGGIPAGATVVYELDNERADLPANGPIPSRVVNGTVTLNPR